MEDFNFVCAWFLEVDLEATECVNKSKFLETIFPNNFKLHLMELQSPNSFIY